MPFKSPNLSLTTISLIYKSRLCETLWDLWMKSAHKIPMWDWFETSGTCRCYVSQASKISPILQCPHQQLDVCVSALKHSIVLPHTNSGRCLVLSQQGAGILSPCIPSVHNQLSLGLSSSSVPFGMASSFLPSSFGTALRELGLLGMSMPEVASSHGNQVLQSGLVHKEEGERLLFFSPYLGGYVCSDEPWISDVWWASAPSLGLITNRLPLAISFSSGPVQ